MGPLDDTARDTLLSALEDASGAKAAKRLMLALAYTDGVAVETLSARYGVPESTIYYWFERIESGPVEAAVTDEPRPGRPPELSTEQRARVADWLRTPPDELGLDAERWSPELLRDRIRAEFGVSYSLGHVRRLLRKLSEESK